VHTAGWLSLELAKPFFLILMDLLVLSIIVITALAGLMLGLYYLTLKEYCFYLSLRKKAKEDNKAPGSNKKEAVEIQARHLFIGDFKVHSIIEFA